MRTLRVLFFIIVSGLLAGPTNASHLIGGEMTYRCIGGNTFRIFLALYRDCAGIPAPVSPSILLRSSCGDTLQIIANPVPGTGTEMTLPCPSQFTTCHGGSYDGIQKYQYYLDYTLPHQCSDWIISWLDCCRSVSITTLQGNPGDYLEAHLNDSIISVCHDSPIFNSDPIQFSCIGMTNVIDCSVTACCDSVIYSLAQPMEGPAAYVAYKSGYSATNFISSSPPPSLDPHTGVLTIKPTAQEIGVYVILVKEYRNGVLIGTAMRETNIYTQLCNNHQPQVSGIDSTSTFSIVIPANKLNCFKLYSSDADTGQSTHLVWDSAIAGANFSSYGAAHDSARFCWTPTIADVNTCPHCFTVKVNDNNCPMEGSRSYTYCITVVDSGYLCNYNTITGTCFVDYNQNNIQDFGEPAYNGAMIVSTGNNTTYSSQPDNYGVFRNYPPDTARIITAIQNISFLYYTSSPISDTSNFYSSYCNKDTVNFALIPKPGIQDLRISLFPITNQRVGRDVTYRFIYSNVGTDTMSGNIFVIKDSRLILVSSNPNYISVSGDSIEWGYSNLRPNEIRTINITLHTPLPTIVNAGDVLISTAVIEPVATDSVKADNFTILNEHAVALNPYDPNDKEMVSGEFFSINQVTNGEYLTYLIRFQNVGTDTAFNVVIRDTLDAKLDAGSFQMISASHNYYVNLQNQKYLEWTFNNILLPDSNHNEPASHGYLAYRVKPMSNVMGGDLIKNTASIFFDSNLSVVTNTSVTTIVFPTTIPNVGNLASAIQLFPNPATGLVSMTYTLSKSSNVKIEISNSFGKKVKEITYGREQAGKQELTFDTGKLSAGIYFVKMTVDGNSTIIKMGKMN